jgi:hypothetical protein
MRLTGAWRQSTMRTPSPESTPLRAEGAQMVHLLEERRQVFGFGHRDVVSQLEKARFVERAAPRRRDVCSRACVEGPLHGRQKFQLLANDPVSLGVVLEAGDRRIGQNA